MNIEEMNLEQINQRLDALDIEVRNSTDVAAVNAATNERNELIRRRSELEALESRRQTAAQLQSGQAQGTVIGRGGNAPATPEYNASSREYRTAFLKHLQGVDETFTVEERAAFTHTTANTTAPLPTTMLNEIWDLVSTQHAIMDDVTIYRTGTILEVVKHTAITAGKAKTVNENAANDDENNTFVKVTLSGKDFAKTVTISYAMAAMSIDALEQYLINEISNGIGEAMANDAISTISSGINSANKMTGGTTGTVTYAELAKLFGLLKRVANVTLYASRSTIYNYLVAMVDSTGRPIFQPSAQAGQEGTLIGAVIKVEDSVADGKLLVGDAKKVVYNMVQDITIETDKDIKNHNNIYSGYARGQGVLIDDSAFAEYTVKTA